MNIDLRKKMKLFSHPLVVDDKGLIYCRALHQMKPLEVHQCEICPLWDGLAGQIRCQYVDLMENQTDLTPDEQKKRIQEQLQEGSTEEFPDFVEEGADINFAGLLELPSWTFKEWEMVERAYQFAAKAHKGMTRKGTSIPYITHPIEVAYYGFLLSDNPVVVSAAVLHDVAEDTPYGIKDIEDAFGREVAFLVAQESENKREDLPKEVSWKIRKEEFLEHLMHASKEAKIIALADKLSNVKAMKRDYERIGDNIWDRFNVKDPKAHGWYYHSIMELTKDLSDHFLWQEYKDICTALFGKEDLL